MLEMLSWKELSQETKAKILWYEIRFWTSSLLVLFFVLTAIIFTGLFISQKISPEIALTSSILCLIGTWILKTKTDEQGKEIPKLFSKIGQELNKYYGKENNGN